MFSLIALAATVFCAVTIEMAPSASLATIARETGVSPATAGWSVTAYAWAVVIFAVPLTAVVRRLPLRLVVIGATVAFGLCSGVAALVPSFAAFVAARAVNGAVHALFFSIVLVYATKLATHKPATSVVSTVLMGSSLALAFGNPLTSWSAATLGWRGAIGAWAAAALVLAVVLFFLLPRAAEPAAQPPAGASARHEPRRLSGAWLWGSAALLALFCTGHFIFWTYVTVFMEGAGVSAAQMVLLLLTYGVASIAAMQFLARVDLSRRSWPQVALVLVEFAALTALALAVWPAAGYFALFALIGFVLGVIPTVLQGRVIATAPESIATIANSLMVGAYNVGIGMGAFAGAQLQAAGQSARPLTAAAAMLVVAAALPFLGRAFAAPKAKLQRVSAPAAEPEPV
jgi:predicted MFS family arabinose efflux permease